MVSWLITNDKLGPLPSDVTYDAQTKTLTAHGIKRALHDTIASLIYYSISHEDAKILADGGELLKLMFSCMNLLKILVALTDRKQPRVSEVLNGKGSFALRCGVRLSLAAAVVLTALVYPKDP